MARRDDVIIRFGGDSRGVDKTLGTIRASIGGIGRLAGTVGLGFGTAQLAQSVAESVIALDSMERGFTAVAGSQAAAGKEMEYIKEVSNRLGLELLSTADAYLSLMAAAKGTTLEGEPARRIFEAVSAAMSRLGKSAADTQGALLAVQQMISKGKVSAEELRGQLGERLPGAFQAAARAMGVTTAKLGEMLQAGNLVAEDLLPKLALELDKTGKSSDRVDSLTASMNRLKNKMTELSAVVKTAIVEPLVDDAGTLLVGYERLGILLSHWASGDFIGVQKVLEWEAQAKQSIKNVSDAAANAGGTDGPTTSWPSGPSDDFKKFLDDRRIATKTATELEIEIWRQYGKERTAVTKEAAEAAQKAQENAFKALAKAGGSDALLTRYEKLVGEIADKPMKAKMEVKVDRTEIDQIPQWMKASLEGQGYTISVGVIPQLLMGAGGEGGTGLTPDQAADAITNAVDKAGANP